MSNIADIKPFVQVPSWDDKATFEISGADFRVLYQIAMTFGPLLNSVQQAYMANQSKGIVKVAYQYQDGSGEVPDVVVQEFFENARQQVKDYVAQQTATEDPSLDVEPKEGVEPTDQ